ncbi:DNA-directed RNA polymerase, mitochondrial [Sardina pilchardus]|uniref:DNA-directed RNA polymerase, mitochondrial n=1 Tax=Sardina pilchardus TaxID=27697 RepID=UPI002E1080AE
MSLLRLCAFPKCLTSGLVVDKVARRVLNANHCRSYLRIWNNFEKPLTDTTLVCRRRYSVLIPKKEEGKTRMRQQHQLLDVLEARIQQLQSDVVLDISNVQFLQLPKTGRGTASSKGRKNVSGEKGEMPKAGQPKSKDPGEPSAPKKEKRSWKQRLETEEMIKKEKLNHRLKFMERETKKAEITQSKKAISTTQNQKQAKTKKQKSPRPADAVQEMPFWEAELDWEKDLSLMQPGTTKKAISTTQKQKQAKTKKQKSPRPADAVQEMPSWEAELDWEKDLSLMQPGTTKKAISTTQKQKQAKTKKQKSPRPADAVQEMPSWEAELDWEKDLSLMQPGTTKKAISTTQKQKQAKTKKQKSPRPADAVQEMPSWEAELDWEKDLSLMQPGTTKKTISTTQKQKQAKTKKQKSPRPADAVQEMPSWDAELDLNISAEPFEVEALDQQVNQPASLDYKLLEDRERNRYGEVHLSLNCFLETCVFIGEVNRAQRCLDAHHRKRDCLSISAYNIMLRVWAKRGCAHHIGHIFAQLEEIGLKPNLSSYSAALECMGRNSDTSPISINRCLQKMEQDGMTVKELLQRTAFRQDERDMVVKAVRVVRPDFQPNSPSDREVCSSPLVQEFYREREDVRYPKLPFSTEDLKQRFQEQLDMEMNSNITISSVEALKPVTPHMAKMRTLLASQRETWQKVLLQALKDRKEVMYDHHRTKTAIGLYPYLCILEDEEYVDAMLQNLAHLPCSGQTLAVIATELGGLVYNKFCIRQKAHDQMVDKLARVYSSYVSLLAQDTPTSNVLPRERWEELEAELSAGPSLLCGTTPWPSTLLVQLGTFLVELMVQHLTVPCDLMSPNPGKKLVHALYHMYTFRSSHSIGFVKPHPFLVQLQSEALETDLTFETSVIPMLCPPLPWTSPRFGAYLLTPAKLMRAVDGAMQHQLCMERKPNHELHAVLDALNQLGACAWRINGPLLDIIIGVFNGRGDDRLSVPPPVSEAPPVPRFSPRDPKLSQEEKAKLKREVIRARRKFIEMHGLRMDALYKLSIANHMRHKIFWFPHNMDFRGRTYPCPPHFNHLGSDVTRALLVFAEGKRLGPHGLDWLKIHLVNLTGLKKRSSMAGRLAYANSIMEDILDSADHPLTGRRWWMEADEPWQALGCCMEIASAARSPDHTEFISHFPVHQDGSCNGLQHYAALGRDVIGATSVNLAPCDEPQDVYSGVAQQVEEFRVKDAENGLPIAQVLEGFIGRKVVKQTVMTVVYGVTRFGGRLQIQKRLMEIDDFPKEHVWSASHYLVHQVFNSLKEMFTGTREIQDWLTDSARMISQSGSTVEWVTPLGLPIIQPYHTIKKRSVNTGLQGLTLLSSYDTTRKPNTMKQKNAFPPNFIHSLDSSHMMLTALYCYSAGLTFVSVHDCFWTHAITVDTMNKICREQFVALHSQPILEDLSKFMLTNYCSEFPAHLPKTRKRLEDYMTMVELLGRVPEKGDFDLECVKDSIYFFS